MKRPLITFTAMTIAVMCCFTCKAQRLAVKTNLLYDALFNANLGVELKTAPHWSIDLSGNYNGWKLSNGRQWKHWFIQPEARYWVKEAMNGHFFAANLIGGQFNTTLNNARRQGWGAGIGAGYGYSWRFGPHWGLEAELTAGYIRYGYDKYPCTQCGRKAGSRNRNYFGPTKAAINIVYYFGDSKKKEPAVEIAVIPTTPVTEAAVPEISDTLPKFNFILVDVPHSRVLSQDISGVARVHFAVNRTTIDRNLDNNSSELDAIVAKLDSIRNNLNMQIVSVRFTGYASPEGSYNNNDRLASGRTAALREYIQQTRNLPDSVISEHHIAEDWAGLRDAVSHSGLADKDGLLSIIDSDRTADAKEAAIKKHRASWSWIASEILPQLRRTEYLIRYEHRYEEQETRTLEEVNRAITAGDVESAARLLVDIPSSPEADYARGVTAALQGRHDEAEAWFIRAQSRGIGAATDALTQLKAYTTSK